MNRLWIALLFFLVGSGAFAFAETATRPSAEEASIRLEGPTVTYAGKITDKNVERFRNTVKGKKISVLIISSGGGEVNAGMKLGEWVFDQGVDIVVEQMCMSSCANYVFTAGRRKTIAKNAIVAWHGSILQKFGMSDEDVRAAAMEGYGKLPPSEKKEIDAEIYVSRSIRQMREYRAATMARQEQFFKKIGVDEYLCRVGTEEYGAKDFFVLSVKDMARFGVLDVQAPEHYGEIDLTPYRQKGKSVEFIQLK